MAISIKDENVDSLAREVATMLGTSITGAVEKSLQEMHTKLARERDREKFLAEIKAITSAVRAEMDASGIHITSDCSDLYDEDGLPI